VDQNNNNSQNEFLWTLLANPANDAHSYTYNLQQLVNEFPQSGILQALLAHAGGEKNLRQASVYFNPKSLYKLINAPATFVGVPDEKIITENKGDIISFVVIDPKSLTEVKEIIIRLKTANFDGIVSKVKDAGFKVQ